MIFFIGTWTGAVMVLMALWLCHVGYETDRNGTHRGTHRISETDVNDGDTNVKVH